MSDLAFVRPVDTVSVADRVTNELRNAILSGRLQPDQEFSLRQIAGQLGVSFIPVREALRSLEAEGLLVTHRGRSASVAPMTSDEVASIFRLRRLIEPEFAAQSANRHSHAELDRLEQAIDGYNDPALDLDDHYDRHHTVHLELLRPATTSWDIRQLELLVRATMRYLRHGVDQVGEAIRPARPDHAEGHYELLMAYRAESAEGARAALERHLDVVERLAAQGVAARV